MQRRRWPAMPPSILPALPCRMERRLSAGGNHHLHAIRDVMTIETERLRMRRYTADDADIMMPILSDPVTMKFWPRPFTEEEARTWVLRNLPFYEQDGYGRYLVTRRSDGAIIGDCGIVHRLRDESSEHDLGYIIHHPYQGNGYATEGARALLRHAFQDRTLPHVSANMAHDNEPSRHVAEKIGMRLVREFFNERNRGIRTFLFTIERGEWSRAQAIG
ncbi:MAG TPA: GNAT family N-acetyltransferase [Candidatus Kapabacteria bacterium]|nr:GNAT family N-acetyltransferase [Candidatus Kapabacteria bacterium]